MIPSGLTYLSYVCNYGTYNAKTGLWHIGNLPNGALATLIIKCILSRGSGFTNNAVVSTSSFDPNLNNNMVSLTRNYVNSDTANKDDSSHENTIPMQNTGIPVIPLFIGLIMLMGGFFVTRKKLGII